MPVRKGTDSEGSFYRWGDQAKYHFDPKDLKKKREAYLRAAIQGAVIEDIPFVNMKFPTWFSGYWDPNKNAFEFRHSKYPNFRRTRNGWEWAPPGRDQQKQKAPKVKIENIVEDEFAEPKRQAPKSRPPKEAPRLAPPPLFSRPREGQTSAEWLMDMAVSSGRSPYDAIRGNFSQEISRLPRPLDIPHSEKLGNYTINAKIQEALRPFALPQFDTYNSTETGFPQYNVSVPESQPAPTLSELESDGSLKPSSKRRVKIEEINEDEFGQVENLGNKTVSAKFFGVKKADLPGRFFVREIWDKIDKGVESSGVSGLIAPPPPSVFEKAVKKLKEINYGAHAKTVGDVAKVGIEKGSEYANIAAKYGYKFGSQGFWGLVNGAAWLGAEFAKAMKAPPEGNFPEKPKYTPTLLDILGFKEGELAQDTERLVKALDKQRGIVKEEPVKDKVDEQVTEEVKEAKKEETKRNVFAEHLQRQLQLAQEQKAALETAQESRPAAIEQPFINPEAASDTA